MSREKAVFLDRDGTLIIDKHYLGDPSQVELLPGVHTGLTALKNAGYTLALITNQSGIGRGLISLHQCQAVNMRLEELLGLTFDAIAVCPHSPEEGCDCRKPKPDMILRVADSLDIVLADSWMMGDKDIDALAGLRAGCRAITLGKCNVSGAYAAADFPSSVEQILKST